MKKARVILFKPSGKYYTEEEWTIPEKSIGPYDMERSPDFRRISGGSVLIESQEPWGYPHLFPGGTIFAPKVKAEEVINQINFTNIDPPSNAPSGFDAHEAKQYSSLEYCQCGHRRHMHSSGRCTSDIMFNPGKMCSCSRFTTAEHFTDPAPDSLIQLLRRVEYLALQTMGNAERESVGMRYAYNNVANIIDRMMITTAEQSSSYYKSEQSERSSQSPEPQPFDRFQCKFLRDQIVANLEAHMANTLESDRQEALAKERVLSFHTSLALLTSLVVECPTCYILVAQALSSLHQTLDYSHPTHMAHYFSPPVPQVLQLATPENLDLHRRAKRNLGPKDQRPDSAPAPD